MKKEEAADKLETGSFKYLIMGYIYDGKKTIPPNYEMSIALANEENVLDEIGKFVEVRVYNLSEEGTSQQWNIKSKAHVIAKAEREERSLLQKLKEKYES